MEIPLDRSITPFDLDHTIMCGQLFRWEKFGDWWYGVVGERIIKVKQSGDKLLFQSYPKEINPNFFVNYFRLDDNLPLIYSQIGKDQNIREAIQRFNGLRICRQELWESLITFICATYKNIPAIKNMIFNISKRFGNKIAFGNHDLYTFPSPSTLAMATLEEIEECRVGFRAGRILEASRTVASGKLDLDNLKKLDYAKAKLELLSILGVGHKVADCILLFSMDKLEAFPVDVWMKRAILQYYSSYFEDSFIQKVQLKGSITASEYETFNLFGREYFGEYAGYAQQYLFLLSRSLGIRNNSSFKKQLEYTSPSRIFQPFTTPRGTKRAT